MQALHHACLTLNSRPSIELRTRCVYTAHARTSASLLVLNWPSMCARLLCNKLSFLFRVCNGGSTSLSTQVFRTIAVSDVTSMSIVKQCHFLDSILGTKFTNEVLSVNSEVSLRDLKKRILEADRLRTIEKSDGHPSLFYVLRIASG